ncbi:hypothetical protein E2C01_015719 [Portunus trituberculatus]|uniref:Uncharacterized protein n=1 Tax=Portunus trituberculatus TaxID=210409 RepID=A0A5B7DNJ6_PORTR|nr:hypothetical protein [Portunus trituberculatus]
MECAKLSPGNRERPIVTTTIPSPTLPSPPFPLLILLIPPSSTPPPRRELREDSAGETSIDPHQGKLLKFMGKREVC